MIYDLRQLGIGLLSLDSIINLKSLFVYRSMIGFERIDGLFCNN